jgi:hypothetical protein
MAVNQWHFDAKQYVSRIADLNVIGKCTYGCPTIDLALGGHKQRKSTRTYDPSGSQDTATSRGRSRPNANGLCLLSPLTLRPLRYSL